MEDVMANTGNEPPFATNTGGQAPDPMPGGPLGGTRRNARGALIAVNVLVFAGSGIAALASVWTAFGAYFSLSGTPNPTPGEIVALDVWAAASVLLGVGSVVLALVIRGRWAIVFGTLSAVGLVAAVIVAALLTSPQWNAVRPVDTGPDLPSNYQPCYSGSNTCN
ncbi:hypothetical protein [Subtercola sp. YIM 133946]|uniref:hypothetical protein n=1 Tax=Subtercola sp. YIM 133946 TaxID=3118909 RepID=UPI002F935DC5